VSEMRHKYATYKDSELVVLLKNGTKEESEAAFTEIYDRYGLRINAYCRSILGDRDQAEDIFQETFLRFYQKVRADYKSGSVIGFLITISRNLCLNAKRNAKPTIPIEEFEFVGQEDNVYEQKELSNLMMMALDLIDPMYKEAIVMRAFNDMRYKEIAEILDITEARARYLVYNGKQKIKTVLTPYLKDTFK
jgi:RNA polymerase sigma factor (sigma-70 family)